MKAIGKGKTASVYDRGDGTVVKLFNEDAKKTSIEKEYRFTRIANALSIPSPKAISLIDHENRSGIVLEKLQGKTMLDHIIDGAPIEGMVETMVRLHRSIQNHKALDLPSYKDALKA
ncbi:MAG: phosphotransferase, partial [Bacillota bacterium]